MAKQNIFRSAFAGMIAARQREANRYVNAALLSMDDDALKVHGYKREDLQKRAINYL